ncbi:hypothetical protein BpHYR1_032839 [Brachionus plicatilis]|uniref:Transmembrane protein n=1 Tax=Brachionus plicatilis TaxID=10195 RepID=A0A3M7QN78_BRAPC|nr:hypothetical protein BpHYR1_032839 [Brachionus plicatilis]
MSSSSPSSSFWSESDSDVNFVLSGTAIGLGASLVFLAMTGVFKLAVLAIMLLIDKFEDVSDDADKFCVAVSSNKSSKKSFDLDGCSI